MMTFGGYEDQRKEAADWHLRKGGIYEENFYFERAYDEYRRARLLYKDDPDVWLAYTDIIRKLGFQEHYRDSLNAALKDIPETRTESTMLKRRLDLLEHSEQDSIADRWNISDPWIVETAEWDVGVYVLETGHSLPIHSGSQDTLAMYFADLADIHPDIRVPTDSSGWNLEVRKTTDFSAAFKKSRELLEDYFIILTFAETERTFSASGELYLARTGERIGRFDELRTGQGKVSDTLHVLADTMSDSIPGLMKILSVDGNRVLMNKGRWHGIGLEEPWIVIRNGAGRPAAVDGGLSYTPGDYLGKVDINEISEPLCEGTFVKSGDFDFISPGDELFLLPVPEPGTVDFNTPDPAFRARLLAIP